MRSRSLFQFGHRDGMAASKLVLKESYRFQALTLRIRVPKKVRRAPGHVPPPKDVLSGVAGLPQLLLQHRVFEAAPIRADVRGRAYKAARPILPTGPASQH